MDKDKIKVDISSLTVEDLAGLGNEALQEALTSVIRNDETTLDHRDHGSHSNVNND